MRALVSAYACAPMLGALPRDEVLRLLATGAALLHEDAGPAVAHTHSMGNPVVRLGHARPSLVVACWPTSPARCIASDGPRRTTRQPAVALEDHLEHPAPVLGQPRPALRPLEDLRRACDTEGLDRTAGDGL